MLTEPDVALTDYAFAVECGVLIWVLTRRTAGDGRLRAWFLLFFGSLGAAALSGGTVHGFFLEEETTAGTILWLVTLLAIGVTALAGWGIGSAIEFAPPLARGLASVAAVEFVAYAVVVLLVNRAFAVAVVNYLPAAAFMLVTFVREYRRTRARSMLMGAAGLATTFVASWTQYDGVALPRLHLSANAVYHILQAGAMALVYLAARRLVVRGTARFPC